MAAEICKAAIKAGSWLEVPEVQSAQRGLVQWSRHRKSKTSRICSLGFDVKLRGCVRGIACRLLESPSQLAFLFHVLQEGNAFKV